MNEVHYIRRTVRLPRGHFAGEIAEGWYVVVDGFLVMTDEDGKPVDSEKHRLDPGVDAHILAHRLLRERRRGPGPRGFSDKIIYPKVRY